MKERFVQRKFKPETLAIIIKADEIIREYQDQGFRLTLRQIYYQFVARAIIANKQTEYKRLGSIINDARLAGLLDWDGIEDRTRNLESPSTWTSPQSIISAVADQYQEDPWKDQRFRPEVWIEKEALVGVVEPICRELRIPYFACRGYASQSELYAHGNRFHKIRRNHQTPVVLHLGDHDPSGLDMTRDNRDRLTMFCGAYADVRRLALNMDQIDEYAPPPNPAKDTDARFEGYLEKYGDESWELDALEPAVIAQLIEDEVDALRDMAAWEKSIQQETERKKLLELAAADWGGVVEYLSSEA